MDNILKEYLILYKKVNSIEFIQQTWGQQPPKKTKDK
jgi:hypothetical protein